MVHPGLHALIAIGLALALLVVLLHRKVKIGRAMILAALALAWMLGVTPRVMWGAIREEWVAKPPAETTGCLFLALSALVLLVNVLGAAMQEAGVSQRLAPALHSLFRSRRAALSLIPFMMGMLPTPGGIMLSAPMVRDLGDGVGVDRTKQAAINFWFRHQLESVWPLFPAVPLAGALFRIEPARLLAHNLAISLTGLAAGVVFLLLRGMPPKRAADASTGRTLRGDLRDFAQAFWPIALAAALYVGLNWPAAVGIFAGIVLFLLFHRVPPGRWGRLFWDSLEWDFALLILGALVFKLNLEAVGAIVEITRFFQERQVPPLFLIFFLPFLVAFLTGVTMPTVAMTFPLLKGFVGEGAEAHVGLETLAFSGVIFGLMLTPVHLCLSLSTSYFEAPLGRIVVALLPPALCVAAAGFAMGWFLG
jgi:hypothetical protein